MSREKEERGAKKKMFDWGKVVWVELLGLAEMSREKEERGATKKKKEFDKGKVVVGCIWVDLEWLAFIRFCFWVK